MPLSRSARVIAAVVALAGLAACEEHTVAVHFEPEVGDVYRFRAEIDTEVVRTLDQDVSEEADQAVLETTQTVRAVADDEVLVRVSLQQGDAAPRTVDVRLDRASRLTAIDLIEGVPATALGLDLAMDLPADISSPPTGPLEPGDRWTIERRVTIGDLPRPVTIEGRGRIDSLGVEDGRRVAVAVVELQVPVRSVVDADGGQARVVGVQRTRSETAYDLADGAMRRDRTITNGAVSVVVEPPPGIDAAPVRGDLRYRIETSTARVTTSTTG